LGLDSSQLSKRLEREEEEREEKKRGRL